MPLDTKVATDDITEWAERSVNLPSERAKEYREQGNRLRKKLEAYIDAHPSFDLVKMLNSGSVEKGSALRTKSDMDVGVYVKRASAPEETPDLVGWLRERLIDAYGDIVNSDQITSDNASVKVEFRGSGVDVECVPILYDGEADNYGELLLRTGKRVRTSISKHVDFFRKRKNLHPGSFSQFVRLLRYWRHQRDEEGEATLPAFAIELIAAHLVDGGLDPSDYPKALQAFFSFIARSRLDAAIIFTDNYAAKDVPDDGRPVRVIDPVAANNNVTKDLTSGDLFAIVESAKTALDDVTIARTATTKEDAIEGWRALFGPGFNL